MTFREPEWWESATEAGGAQAADQLAGIDLDGAAGQRSVPPLGGEVVVVTVKGPTGKAEPGGEAVQLAK